MENWKMTLKFDGSSFENMKAIAGEILKQVTKARTYKELPIAGGGGSGQGGNNYSFSVEYSCPVEQRIANLRAEAAALEATL